MQKIAPGFDLISGKLLKELSKSGIKIITIIFNDSSSWKVADAIMIPKPEKNNSKKQRRIDRYNCVVKNILKPVQRISPTIEKKITISDHQFGFINRHGTIEQV